jgi:NAD(P)-dependent dehydrogenase (short-subunit alcohol dehydrogenase family)
MSLIGFFKSSGPTGFGYNSTAEDVTAGLSLAGKNILVTGCNSGLGLETSRVLAMRGARVLGTARTAEKATEAFAGMPGSFSSFACELSQPASVRACVEAVKREGVKLDAIICNAGIMAPPKLEQACGYELQFFTNHIGHFILVTGLLDALADDGRVVMVSSEGHNLAPKGGIEFDNLSGEKGYSRWAGYGQSKLANILMAKQLARRFAGTKKTANALHPGVINTNLARQSSLYAVGYAIIGPIANKTTPQGAATQTYVAVHPAAASVSGEYWSDCNVAKARRDADDVALAERLWAESEKIVAAVG